jgi:uncharacterized LabA/DUF88 family protein/cold shock CspA family protein
VFVDSSNIFLNGGQKMRYDVLRSYAQVFGSVQRLNAYISYDAERGEDDPEYRNRAIAFQEALRAMGVHITIKTVRWMLDSETGRRFGKANADIELVVDAISQSNHLDHVILVTGDGDFVRAVRYIRDLGCRVEVIGFDNVSTDLKMEVDGFTSGYLIPELLPTNPRNKLWGSVGSTVRGVCYYHQPDESYGFLSFLGQLSPLAWQSDPRMPDSPYKAVFFHDSNLPEGVLQQMLPNRWVVFEFEVGQNERGLTAENMRLVGNKAEMPPDRLAREIQRERERFRVEMR